MTPKPICVIYFPENMMDGKGNKNWIYEYMWFLNGGSMDNSSVNYGEQSKWKDYHWFCFHKHDISEPKLVVYHPQDFQPIQYENLMKLINECIKNAKINNDIKD